MARDTPSSERADLSYSLFDRDMLAGLFFTAIGCVFAAIAWLTLDIGSARRMGPGFFPLVVSALLILIGGAIAIRAFRRRPDTPSAQMKPRVKPWSAAAVISAPVLFALTIRDLGFLPAVMLTGLAGSFASLGFRPMRAALVTILLTGLCCFVFVYGLGLPIPLLGQWLTR